MNLSIVILTMNESLHLERCIRSVMELAHEIVVVDSGSVDNTVEIAKRFGAKIVTNTWVNYSTQFKFGVLNISSSSDWIMRIDADEYLTEELRLSVCDFLASAPSHIEGAYFPRRMTFMGRHIKYGGIFPAYMLRLFRVGKGEIEDRWMDEHIKVQGDTVVLNGGLIDDNLNSLTWWTEKHNKYASREAVDLLNLEFSFMNNDSVASIKGGAQPDMKRWVKEKIYSRLPIGFRAMVYFLYRYVVRFGFLDGKEGTMFHFLQGYWYRYLVDCKVYEVKKYMKTHDSDIKLAIAKVLDIKV
ncbi:MAG: glycosyltransferase family 2 protein [Limnobacter sp.]|uniref:glycosyltransferase family 2 protein n=1 Tax=Limnobacter sp. TaxID=2003368 RepID=UPI004037B5A4